MCRCPLSIIVETPPEVDITRELQTYYKFKPIAFTKNISRMMIINLHMRTVCTHCYMIKKTKMSWFGHLRRRETGGPNIFITKQDELKPLTHDEILKWFTDFNEFINRPDVNDYIIETKPVRGLIICSERVYR